MTHTEKDDLVERLQSAMCPGSERCNVLTCYPDCECGAMEAAATRITALERELAEAREALKPFSEMAGELFARNWNNSDIVTVLDNPDDPHRITAGDYFNARRAYANKGELT